MHLLFTIGHSTHPIDRFIGLLSRHDVTAVADVRSAPYSRFNPQFNREPLAAALKAAGLEYVFLGDALGGRSEDPAVYRDGRVQYDLLARTELFKSGLERVMKGAEDHRIALMCAEKDPLDCHRAVLVARRLAEKGMAVRHILPDGTAQTHDALIDRLIEAVGLGGGDLFRRNDELVREAWSRRGQAIAYTGKPSRA